MDVDECTCLVLFVGAGEERQLLAKDLLLVQHLLVVHVLEQVRVVNAVGTKELGVGHLERLTDRLCYQLSLQRPQPVLYHVQLN